jgi:hypothetical protein
LPEEWLIEQLQQVGATSGKLFSPSFIAICFPIAAIFRALGYSFVTGQLFARFMDCPAFCYVVRWGEPGLSRLFDGK